MRARSVLAVALVGVGAALAVFVATRKAPTGPSAPAPVGEPTVPTLAPPRAGALPPPPAGALRPGPGAEAESTTPDEDALAAALRAGDAEAARRAAAALRRALRTDRAAFARAVAALLDRATDPSLRRALAVVLGTIPAEGVDAALLEALGRFRDDPATVADVLLALAAQRTPHDEDDVFDLGDRPHGAETVGGLGITVRRGDLPDDVERALVAHLARGEAPVRDAAARALSESMGRASVRGAFAVALASEPSDDVASRLGRPLADWAAGTTDGAPRDAVVASLLARAGEASFDAYRLRLEDPLARVPLEGRAASDVASLAEPRQPFAIRAFALTVLAKAGARSAVGATAARGPLLAALGDADAAVRDLAARSLGALPYDAETTRRLAAAARGDAAWNVRFSALESLATVAPAEAGTVVLAAERDPDARVAKRATELAARLGLPKR